MWIAAALILGVVIYEMIAKKAPASGTQSAALRARTGTSTAAAQVTSGLSAFEKALQSLLAPKSSAGAGAKPGSAGSIGSGGGNATAARPTQSGFQQPSAQQ